MTRKDPAPSPYERLMARRRATFVRDWLLVLVALGLAIAAGAFHHDRPTPAPPAAASPQEAGAAGAP